MKKSYQLCSIGDQYGRLTIIKDGGRDKYGNQLWWCKCNCGNLELVLINQNQLRTGKTKSCGCLAKENKSRIGKNNKKKSFKEWCIENNKEIFLELWDYGLNSDLPEEIAFTSKKDIYFICKNNPEHHPQHKPVNITKNKSFKNVHCNICLSFGYNLIKEFGQNALDSYWDYEKNYIDPYEISKHTNKKIWIKCQENSKHPSYEIDGNHFWSGRRCPYCQKKNGKIMFEDSLQGMFPSIIDIWSNKNKLSPSCYTSKSGNNVWWKCNNDIHPDYLRTIRDSNKANFNCPECVKSNTESQLEILVKAFISNLGYNVLTEYNCNILPINPYTNHKLPFDNEIPDLKLIIEVHGEQHYRICGLTLMTSKQRNISPEQVLEYQQWKDSYKKKYAIDHGYHYLALSYNDILNNTYKNKIQEEIDNLCYENV